jgi:hypothetical protein
VFDGCICIGNALHGLEIKNSKYVTVTGGKYSDNVRHGIYLNGSVASESVRECTITGAICTDNDSADASLYNGIEVDDGSGTAARNAIVGCVCRSTTGTTKQRYGVHIGTGATSNSVVGCQLFGNKTANLQDDGTSTTTAGNVTT